MNAFRGSTHFPRRLLQRSPSILRQIRRACLTVNGVEAYTLLALCRLARGIAFLLVSALAAIGAVSLCTSGKEHVSRVCHSYVSTIIRIAHEALDVKRGDDLGVPPRFLQSDHERNSAPATRSADAGRCCCLASILWLVMLSEAKNLS